MNKSLWRPAAIALAALSVLSIAPQSSQATSPPPPLMEKAEKAENARERFIPIETLTTKSGIDVWFVEDRSVPVLSIKFFFENVGAAYDGADKQGLARLVSNTLDEGAGSYDAKAFQKALNDYSISLSFGSGRDDFSGQLKTLTRYQDKAFELLKLALNEPRFDDEAVTRMREANIARIKSSLSDPSWLAARLFNDTFYGDHPYALNSGGTISTLNALTADDLRAYVARSLTRDRLHVAVTGAINKNQLLDAIDDIFGDLPEHAESAPAPIASFTWPKSGKSALYHIDGLPQSKIMLALPSVRIDDPRYYTMKLMTTILGGSGFGSRLMEEIREKHGLTYGIYSYTSESDASEMMHIVASSQNATVAELLSRTMGELKRMADTPVSEEELKAHRDYLIGSMPLTLTSTDQISGLMQQLQMQNLPADYLDRRADQLRKVTTNDIQTLAKEILDNNKVIAVIAGGVKAKDIPGTATGVYDFTVVTDLPNVE